MPMGISASEARALLRDVSRNKFESQTTDVLSLNRSCVVYGAARRNGGSSLQLLTFGYQRGVLLSFVPTHREYAALASVRSIRQGERALLRRCRWRKLGIGVPFSLGLGLAFDKRLPLARDEVEAASGRLLLDALGHAVPLYEAYTSSSSPLAVLQPTRGEPPPFFLPLLFKGHATVEAMTAALSSPSAKVTTEEDVASLGGTDAFLSTVRALTTRGAAALAADVESFVRERCACFERLHATGAPYNILSRRPRSVQRWWRVRRAMLRSALHLVPPQPARPRSLILLAHSTMPDSLRLQNTAEVCLALTRGGHAVEATPLDAPMVTHVQRLALLGRARTLVSVSSALLAYAAFLPADEHPGACSMIEIYDASQSQQRGTQRLGDSGGDTATRSAHRPRAPLARDSASSPSRYPVSGARSALDPFVLLATAVLGEGRFLAVGAWPAVVPSSDSNCTRRSRCLSVDASAVVRAVSGVQQATALNKS
jgi:hypothetical protein